MAEGGENRRLSGLDALRGVASFCVLIFHYHVLTRDGAGVGKAYLAVDFFFCLSGFLMARTYEERLAGGMSAYKFLRVRFARLFPTMLVGGIIGLPMLYLNQPGPFFLSAPLNLLMLPAVVPGLIFPLNTPAWSILAELFANAFHKVGANIRTGVLAITVLALMLPLAWLSTSPKHLDLGSTHATFLGMLCRVMFSYFLGVIIWRRWGERPPLHLPRWLTVIALPTFFATIWFFSIDSGVADLLFIFILSPLMIIGGLQLGGGKIGQFAGALSFPLYAIHYPLIELMLKLGSPSPMIFAACLGLASLIAFPGSMVRLLRHAVGVRSLNRFGSAHPDPARGRSRGSSDPSPFPDTCQEKPDPAS